MGEGGIGGPTGPRPTKVVKFPDASPAQGSQRNRPGAIPVDTYEKAPSKGGPLQQVQSSRQVTGAAMQQSLEGAGVDEIKKKLDHLKNGLTGLQKGTQGAADLYARYHWEGLDATRALNSKLTGLSKELGKVEREMASLAENLKSGRFAGKASRQRLAALGERSAELRGLTRQLTLANQQLADVNDALGKTAGKLDLPAKRLEGALDATKLSQTGGKILFGLDALANFSEFQKTDPQNWEKNLVKAFSVTGSKMGFEKLTEQALEKGLVTGRAAQVLKGAGPADLAAGLVKLGLESLGMGKTETYRNVDALSQALPSDIVAKGFGQAIDQTYALGSLAFTGSSAEAERLHTANLDGKNGLVMQGAAILSEGLWTLSSGQPMARGTADRLAKVDTPLQGLATKLFDMTGVSSRVDDRLGASTPEKIALVKGLARGSGTSGEETTQIREILRAATPGQLVHILDQVDTDRLIDSSRVSAREYGRTHDPIGTLLRILHHKGALAEAAGDGRTRVALESHIEDLVGSTGRQGRREAIGELKNQIRPGGYLHDLQPRIRTQIERL
jgi:hypothetical protein